MDGLVSYILSKKYVQTVLEDSEQIETAINKYLDEHPMSSGATAEQAAQIEQNVAELADIRIGADGTVYDSAGTAVRTQSTNLKSDLSYVNNALFSDTYDKRLVTVSAEKNQHNVFVFYLPVDGVYVASNKPFTVYSDKVADGNATVYGYDASGNIIANFQIPFSGGYATINVSMADTVEKLRFMPTDATEASKLYVIDDAKGVEKQIVSVQSKLTRTNVCAKKNNKEIHDMFLSELVKPEYASGPKLNAYFVPTSDSIAYNKPFTLFIEEFKCQTVEVLATNDLKSPISTSISFAVDEYGFVVIEPDFDKTTAYFRIICRSISPSLDSACYEVVPNKGILNRLDILENQVNNIGRSTDKKISKSKYEGLKVLFMSDVHYGLGFQRSSDVSYGYTDDERMDLLIDAVKKENELGTIDMIFFLGDMVTNQEITDSTTGRKEQLLPNFIKKMDTMDIPYMCAVGNHDLCTDDAFNEIFGYPSNYIVEIKGYSFIVLNMFTVENTINPSSAGMGCQDISSELKNSIMSYLDNTDNTCVICCHGFDDSLPKYSNVYSLVTHDKVEMEVHGHSHGLMLSTISSNKIVCTDGHFSYSFDGSNYWSYRILENTEDYKGTYVVQPSERYYVDDREIEFERTESFPKVWKDTRIDYGVKIIKM